MAAPRTSVLTENQILAVEYMILNRFRKPSSKEIGDKLGLKPHTITAWKKIELFQEELDRRTMLYKSNYEDVQLADRKERVVALQTLYDRMGDEGSTTIKLKILQEIRAETGGNAPIQVEMHHSLGHGPDLPKRADDYDEWCEQNRKMLKVEAEYIKVEDGKEKERNRIAQGILPEGVFEEGSVSQGKVNSEGNGRVN